MGGSKRQKDWRKHISFIFFENKLVVKDWSKQQTKNLCLRVERCRQTFLEVTCKVSKRIVSGGCITSSSRIKKTSHNFDSNAQNNNLFMKPQANHCNNFHPAMFSLFVPTQKNVAIHICNKPEVFFIKASLCNKSFGNNLSCWGCFIGSEILQSKEYLLTILQALACTPEDDQVRYVNAFQ